MGAVLGTVAGVGGWGKERGGKKGWLLTRSSEEESSANIYRNTRCPQSAWSKWLKE